MLTIDVRPYRLALRAALTTAHGMLRARRGLLLSVTEGGLTGWGEAAPMPGWSAESHDDVADALAAAAAGLGALSSVDDARVDDILDDLEDRPHARAAVAGAVHDLRARRAGVSLRRLLDPSAPDGPVAVNAVVADTEPVEVGARVGALAAGGYRAVKLKVGAADPAVDIARVAAAHDAAGPEVELRVDANGGWDHSTAVSVLDELVDLGVAFCEEPVAGIEAIAEVGAASAVPVAVDESARTLDDLAVALGTRAIDVIVVKPQAVGGPDLALRAVRLARENDASAVVTTMIDSAVGVAHAAQVAAASGSPLAHGLDTSRLLADDVAAAPEVEAGRLFLPAGPGLGVAPQLAD